MNRQAMAASSYRLVLLLPLALAVLASSLLVRGQSCGAMTHAGPGDDFASLMAKTIANFEVNCRGKKKHQPTGSEEGRSWPQGVYGLPMPTSGCPTDSGFVWETGSRFHDTEDSLSNNEWSGELHLKGPYGQDNMWQHFCMKTVDRVGDTDPLWPSGEYCVFKYGQNCSSGMSSGIIFWDDEDDNNDNSVNGTVPSGVYDQDTLIHFCCMTSGDASAPITLPSHSPFYLFAYVSTCQAIQGMDVSREKFSWDGENNGTSYGQGICPDGRLLVDIELEYCYYTVTI